MDTAASQHDVFAIIIGAGFSGIAMGVALADAGVEDFLIVEATDGVGGVWHDNTYPGAACDVPSHLYSFSFEPKTDWSRRYADQAEIRGYLEHCWEKYDLQRRTRLETRVTVASYDEASKRWRVTLSDDRTLRCRILIPACGQLNIPAVPNLPGLDQFQGEAFHSARWNHDVDLAGKRVGVIGTGASAIQFVPEVAEKAAAVTVFQRSAPYVLPKPDRAYTPREKRRFARWPWWQNICRRTQFITHELRGWFLIHGRPALKLYMWRYKKLLEKKISDPGLRAKLDPDHVIGCKRILFSNRYLEALDADHVDVETASIESIDATGITAGGHHHTLDALIFGTGFAATDLLASVDIIGREGARLADRWAEGAHAYHGMSISGFPNFFVMYGPNTNLGHNSIIYMLEGQARYIAKAARWLKVNPDQLLDVNADTEGVYDRQIQHQLTRSIWATGCQNWYQNAAGRIVNNWPGLAVTYRRMISRFRSDVYR